jgi:hypothetical protein
MMTWIKKTKIQVMDWKSQLELIIFLNQNDVILIKKKVYPDHGQLEFLTCLS